MKAFRRIARTFGVIFCCGILSFLSSFDSPDASAQERPLVKAAEAGDLKEVERLLANRDGASEELCVALGVATSRGHLEVMRLLLDAGVDPNQQDCSTFPSEHLLSLANDGAMNLLLEYGADLAAKNHQGETPWMTALRYGSYDRAKMLLDRWIETPSGRDDVPAAFVRYAIEGNAEQIRSTLESGAGRKLPDIYRLMAFTVAVDQGHADIVRFLLANGINADASMYGGFGKETALARAVSKDRTDVLRVLLKAGADPNDWEPYDREPALVTACRSGRIDVVKLLLDHGASPMLTFDGQTDNSPLVAAAGGGYLDSGGKGGHLDIVKLLVAKGADVNGSSGLALDPSGDYWEPPLPAAAREGHLEVVRYLLEKGANIGDGIGCKNCDNSALTLAAYKGRIEVVELFLKKGGRVNDRTAGGRTALMDASGGGKLDMVRFLVDRGANVNAKSEDGATALLEATANGHAEVVKLLLREGAAPGGRFPMSALWNYLLKNEEQAEVEEKGGLTLLEVAQKTGRQEIVKILQAGPPKEISIRARRWQELIMASIDGDDKSVVRLLDEGAYVDPEDRVENTPLILASAQGHADMVKLLLAHGASVNHRNWRGATALREAAEHGQVEVAKMLLDNGADPNLKDKEGSTPLMLAAANGSLDMVKLLLEKGANVNAKAYDGNSPLLATALNGYLEIVRVLLDKGADIDTRDGNGENVANRAFQAGHTEIAKEFFKRELDQRIDRSGDTSAKQQTARTLIGEVVASSPKNLLIKVVEVGKAAQVVEVKLDFRTHFTPYRRPVVGELVLVRLLEDGRVDIVMEDLKAAVDPAVSAPDKRNEQPLNGKKTK